MRKTKIYYLINCALFCFSGFLGLIVCEVALRLENGTFFMEQPLHEETINDIEYAFWFPTHHIESQLLTKQSAIITVGDSFVAGQGCVTQETNLLGHLKRAVNNQHVGFLNLGVGNTNPAHYLDIMLAFDIGIGDTVIILFYDNDLVVDDKTCRIILRQSKKYDLYVPNFCPGLVEGNIEGKIGLSSGQKVNHFLNDFHVWWIIKTALYNIPILHSFFNRTENLAAWSDDSGEQIQWLLSTIPVIKSYLESQGAKAVFGYYPNTNNIHQGDYRHDIWLNFIKEVRNKYQLEILDPYPFLIDNATGRSMTRSLTDKHPSCEAHGIVADFIFQKLRLIDEGSTD